jgi:hypothetical protein
MSPIGMSPSGMSPIARVRNVRQIILHNSDGSLSAQPEFHVQTVPSLL